MARIFGLPKDNRPATAQRLAANGFDAVTVGVDEDASSLRPALDAGLSVWAVRPAFLLRPVAGGGDPTPYLARDVDGEPRVWFGSGCPNHPALREAHFEQVRRAAESGAHAGWLLDGIRFASPHAGEAFFTCFCQRCAEKASRLGFDWAALHRDVRALRDWCRDESEPPLAADPEALIAPMVTRWPGVADWLRFREACVREHVTEVRAAVDELNVRGVRFQLGAYLFAPAFAPLVGQDYSQLTPLLDQVSPMIYRTLHPGDACLASEWASLAQLRLVPMHDQFSPREVGQQVRLARERANPRLVPILQLRDDRLEETVDLARLGGADDLDFFRYRPEDEPYVEIASRGTRARI